ncbi:MAG: hypothetical protein ABL953_08015 [Ilumatobacteraceae bacterium]
MEPTEPTKPTVDVGDELEDGTTGMPVDGVPDVTIEPTLVATARRQHGVAGAIMAAGMLGIDQALGLRKVKQEAPIVVAAPTEPLDIDSDGIDVAVDDQTSVYAPPQPRSKPHVKARRR